jgi:hypothetical protein
MAQEDKGLVLRGLLLLAAIGIIITAVLAMIFWRSEPVEAPLVKSGEAMPSAPGSDVRYAAAAALARRGSAAVPWPLLREMLDERQQLSNNRVRLKDGRDVYDEANARLIMVSALRAIAAWHEKQADKTQVVPAELRDIYAMVDELAKSQFVELKVQAEKARATFFR